VLANIFYGQFHGQFIIIQILFIRKFPKIGSNYHFRGSLHTRVSTVDNFNSPNFLSLCIGVHCGEHTFKATARAFYRFGHVKFDDGSLVLGWNQFPILCKLLQKWSSLQKWSKITQK